jgi:hypothetical protein
VKMITTNKIRLFILNPLEYHTSGLDSAQSAPKALGKPP